MERKVQILYGVYRKPSFSPATYEYDGSTWYDPTTKQFTRGLKTFQDFRLAQEIFWTFYLNDLEHDVRIMTFEEYGPL